MDLLQIKALKIETRIGVHNWEQQILQTLLLDITIPVNLSNCRDDLGSTIDYDKICQTVEHFLSNNSFKLIETVANKTATFIKENFAVESLTITVSKPHAIKKANNISITVHR